MKVVGSLLILIGAFIALSIALPEPGRAYSGYKKVHKLGYSGHFPRGGHVSSYKSTRVYKPTIHDPVHKPVVYSPVHKSPVHIHKPAVHSPVHSHGPTYKHVTSHKVVKKSYGHH